MIDFDLLKAVVKQIQEDAGHGDYTAIEDLLKDIPKKRLVGFLLHDITKIKEIQESNTAFIDINNTGGKW